MAANLKFESAVGRTTTALDQVKIVTLEDNTGNKYTLDITTNDLKVAYTPSGGNAIEYTVNGLATALGKLLTIDGSTVGKSVLAEEVAKQPVVDVLVPALATVGTDDTKKVYTKETANTAFLKTADLGTKVAEKAVVDVLVPALATVGTDDTKKVYTKETANTAFLKTADLGTKVAEKAVVEAIFDAKDGNKLVLVEKLGEFLDSKGTAPYDGTNNQTAKVFLAEKGLKPTPQEVATELAQNNNFKTDVKILANATDSGFQGAVREVMLQPFFDTSTDLNAPISVDW